MRHEKHSQFYCDEDEIAMAMDRAAEIKSGKLNEHDICENCGRDYSRMNHEGWCVWCRGGF